MSVESVVMTPALQTEEGMTTTIEILMSVASVAGIGNLEQDGGKLPEVFYNEHSMRHDNVLPPYA